jgi:hypothetical protein
MPLPANFDDAEYEVEHDDLIGVASDPFLAFLRDWLGPDGPPLVALHQATDPDRFHPAPGGPARWRV